MTDYTALTAYAVQATGFDGRLALDAGRLFFDRDAAEAYAADLEVGYAHVAVLEVAPGLVTGRLAELAAG